MSEARPLLVTESQARQIGELIRGAGVTAGGELQPAAIGRDDSLIVVLQSAIPAGSTDAVLANIQSLDGSSWTDTKQQISVRSLNGLAVSTTGRRIARRISRFGWVVVET